jgi:hypothetical protein
VKRGLRNITAGTRLSPQLLIALVILVAQVGIGIWQHLGKTRYFTWAPNDYAVSYDLRVTVDGRQLTRDEISNRYRLYLAYRYDKHVWAKLGLSEKERYLWEDPPQRLLDRIESYEKTTGSSNPARVALTYQVDGGKQREWRWPR